MPRKIIRTTAASPGSSPAMGAPNLERHHNVHGSVVDRLDSLVDDFVRRTLFFHEPLTRGRAHMFVLQHRQNTRYRNSVLKLRVATNCPDWDIRLRIIGACSEEVIADHEHGGGRPHWAILEEQGIKIGLKRTAIRSAKLLASTQMAWLAWESLMSNRPWLEGMGR